MSPSPDRRRIVVVEDDEPLLELMIFQLRQAGYDAYPARTGKEAIRWIEGVDPAGLVLDINLPVMDGFGVLEEMERLPAAGRCPTMVITARNRAGDVQRALGLGASDFVTKPINRTQFLARVARLVNQPRRRAREVVEI